MARRDSQAPMRARIPTGVSYCLSWRCYRVCSCSSRFWREFRGEDGPAARPVGTSERSSVLVAESVTGLDVHHDHLVLPVRIQIGRVPLLALSNLMEPECRVRIV